MQPSIKILPLAMGYSTDSWGSISNTLRRMVRGVRKMLRGCVTTVTYTGMCTLLIINFYSLQEVLVGMFANGLY